ncbi:hypothetical protein HY345_04665 [Candidatus Microgenomates bacterium]|nr:hypothetical protein [Candidatus Microgenomates bacterium]
MDLGFLRDQSYQTLLDLSSEEGISASSRNEAYGCLFGRDSAITILKILRVYKRWPDAKLLAICKTGLLALLNTQGIEFNLESGEEPGKFIHEFRKNNYERLLKRDIPWFVYQDGILRNYDSVDSTPLTLIAFYRYWEQTKDNIFLLNSLSRIEKGLNWIISFGDKDKDLLIEYEFPINRRYGGLKVQSWTDSAESLKDAQGNFPLYPIAPVEVQAFSWLALKLWADFYLQNNPSFGKKLLSQAKAMKDVFNNHFIFKDYQYYFAAQALNGRKEQIKTITINPLLALWATYHNKGGKEVIFEESYLEDIINRSFENDLYDQNGGLRTMSKNSPTFNHHHNSYHNGSFWPMANGLAYNALEDWGETEKAKQLKESSLRPLYFFKCPIELYIRDPQGNFVEYQSNSGKMGCRFQAWTAATVLDWLI